MALSVIIKKKSNFSGNLLVSRERLKTKAQKAKHILWYDVSVITEEQSSFISSPFVRIAKEIGEKG